MQGSIHHKWVELFSSPMSKRGKVLAAKAGSPVLPGTARLCAKALPVAHAMSCCSGNFPRGTTTGSSHHAGLFSPCLPMWPCGAQAIRRAPALQRAPATRGRQTVPTSVSPPRVSSLYPQVTHAHVPRAPGSVGQFQLIPLGRAFPSSRWSECTLFSLGMCMIWGMGVRGGLSFSEP